MSETKFTPGPWEVTKQVYGDGWDVCHHDADGDRLVVVELDRAYEADARLIAAAPDLYAALKALEERGHTQATWSLALRALAKATVAPAQGPPHPEATEEM